MARRFELRVDGTKVATVWLDPDRQGRITGRLGPLPAFGRVGRLFDALTHARAAFDELGVEAPEEVLASEERALAALSALQLTLVDEGSGAIVPTRVLRLLPGRPWRVRVEW